jgi:hypothetical protein
VPFLIISSQRCKKCLVLKTKIVATDRRIRTILATNETGEFKMMKESLE